MSEQSPPASGEGQTPKPIKAVYTPELSGDWDPETTGQSVRKSLWLFARGAGAIAAVALGVTYLAQETLLDNHNKKPSGASAPQLAGTNAEHDVTKYPVTCKKVDGVLRIVGVTADEIKTINDSDDVDKIPNMVHQRDADGKKADISKFEWRVDDAKLNGESDGPFYTALRYHFRPFTEQNSGPLLEAEALAVPGNLYNAGPAMVGQLVEYGDMTVCAPRPSRGQ